MLNTEKRNPRTTHIDKMETLEMLKIINDETRKTVDAVEQELENIGRAVDAASESLSLGGRIFYIGCGTSGRLGVLDASECPPTFGVASDRVIGIIAGGDKCLRSAAENAEDLAENGVADLKVYNPEARDLVVGISAAGGAKYVLAAIDLAKSIGCVTVGITSNEGSELDKAVDIPIHPDTGAEPVTGSTRMNAGTSQKLILNMISTCAMIKQGYVLENLMINLKPTNIKLKARVIRIVCELTKADKLTAERALNENDWEIRKAVEALK